MIIQRYTADGHTLLQSYGSMTDAMRAFAADPALPPIDDRGVAAAARDRTVYGGFRWACVAGGGGDAAAARDIGPTVERTQLGRRNRGRVCIVDPSGSSVRRVFADAASAARELQVSCSSVTAAVRNGRTCQGNTVVAWDGLPDAVKEAYVAAGNSLPARRPACAVGVVATHQETGAVARFATIQQAATTVGARPAGISAALGSGRAYHCYLWARATAAGAADADADAD